ncbi:MAG: general secretion pathway protein GspB [Candidatus Omnitrophota bacterium]
MRRPKASIAVLILGALILPAQALLAEDKPLVPESLVKELRPSMEFTGEESREPFKDTLYQIKEPEKVETKPVAKEQRPALPQMTVQGIIWGSSIPCVIINNQVYKEGDTISEVKITKIGKEGIAAEYKGWDYNLSSPAAVAIAIKDPIKNPKEGKNEK